MFDSWDVDYAGGIPVLGTSRAACWADCPGTQSSSSSSSGLLPL